MQPVVSSSDAPNVTAFQPMVDLLPPGIGRRIKLVMDAREISARHMAEFAEVSEQAVYKWIKTGHISREKLQLIASGLLKVSVDYLMDGKSTAPPPDSPWEQIEGFARMTGFADSEGMDEDDVRSYVRDRWLSEIGARALPSVRARTVDDEPLSDEVRIKETNISFAAGPGSRPAFEIVEDSEPATYRLSWFQKERLNPNRCIRYRVTNDSQEPFLFAGDTILVNLDETEVKDGKIYAIRYGDELRVKKLRKRITGLTLESWNDTKYPPETLTPDQVDQYVQIIGRVRDKSGRGGL